MNKELPAQDCFSTAHAEYGVSVVCGKEPIGAEMGVRFTDDDRLGRPGTAAATRSAQEKPSRSRTGSG